MDFSLFRRYGLGRSLKTDKVSKTHIPYWNACVCLHACVCVCVQEGEKESRKKAVAASLRGDGADPSDERADEEVHSHHIQLPLWPLSLLCEDLLLTHPLFLSAEEDQSSHEGNGWDWERRGAVCLMLSVLRIFPPHFNSITPTSSLPHILTHSHSTLSLWSLLQMFVSKAAVGSIVGLQSAQIQQMASEYEEKVRISYCQCTCTCT